MIKIKRAYEPPSPDDGTRVLIDRLWPRGVSKEQLQLDLRLPGVAPSNELRRWFHHEAALWDDFRQRYEEELKEPERQADLDRLSQMARNGVLTLVYSARDETHNQAVVLKEVLEARSKH
jgi:uncharacterized protein YeaO (DUF488 family)